MKISRIEAQDLGSLEVLYQQLAQHKPNMAEMGRTLERIANDENHVILGAKTTDGRLVGSCVGVICATLVGKCRPFMVVEDVVIDASYRRAGIARRLMNEIENHARSRNCSYIMLMTDTDRPEAQSFYLSLGYNTEEYRGFKKTLASNT